jgi:RimJ/RimL family protein N-acetyltransferase
MFAYKRPKAIITTRLHVLAMIRGRGVRLKPFGSEDLDFLHMWNNDPEYSGPFEPFEPVSRGELEGWLPSEKPGVLWHIIETSRGEKIGQIVARLQDDDSYQIGFRIVPQARGRGYCTEAARVLIRHLFESGVKCVTAEANPDNKSSRRVLEKLGFSEVGFKENGIEVNGVWLSGIVYELRR